MNVSISILYEQMKKKISDSVLESQSESGLPVFMVVAALKEVLCKYETDSMSALVQDYQALMSEMNKDKEEMICKDAIQE